MLQKIALIIITLLNAAFILCSCSQNHNTATYILTNKIIAGQQEECIEPAELTLTADSSFHYKSNQEDITGSYTTKGQRITLTTNHAQIIGAFYQDNSNIVLSQASTILILQKQTT